MVCTLRGGELGLRVKKFIPISKTFNSLLSLWSFYYFNRRAATNVHKMHHLSMK